MNNIHKELYTIHALITTSNRALVIGYVTEEDYKNIIRGKSMPSMGIFESQQLFSYTSTEGLYSLTVDGPLSCKISKPAYGVVAQNNIDKIMPLSPEASKKFKESKW